MGAKKKVLKGMSKYRPCKWFDYYRYKCGNDLPTKRSMFLLSSLALLSNETDPIF